MKATIRILHLEDDANDAELVRMALDQAGLNPEFKVARSARTIWLRFRQAGLM